MAEKELKLIKPKMFVWSLYDPYLHQGITRFRYGEPFSYFSKEIIFPRPPPEPIRIPLVVSDLKRTAEPFTPGSSPPSPEFIKQPMFENLDSHVIKIISESFDYEELEIACGKKLKFIKK